MHFDSINSHHEIHPSYSLTFMKWWPYMQRK
jgi:hypothetical protein